jgi:hypothetical protein
LQEFMAVDGCAAGSFWINQRHLTNMHSIMPYSNQASSVSFKSLSYRSSPPICRAAHSRTLASTEWFGRRWDAGAQTTWPHG